MTSNLEKRGNGMTESTNAFSADKIREQYIKEIPNPITRGQMVEIITNPTLYAFLRGIYYLGAPDGTCDIEGVYEEGKKYTVKTLDLEEILIKRLNIFCNRFFFLRNFIIP